MNTELIHKLNQIVKENLSNENFGPEQLAEKVGMSHSTLHRKLKEISGQTISQFIRELRLEKAKKILLSEEITISEIAYKVGFGSATYFNKCFHEYYGAAPGEYKKQEKRNEQKSSKPSRKIQKILLTIVAPVLILLFVFLFLNERHSIFNDKSKENSIAVLPFIFIGENLNNKYLADGIMDDILVYLSKIKNLRVISGSSVEQYRSTEKSLKTIGKELNVKNLLEGNFHQNGENFKLTLHLKNAEDESIVWSENYNWNVEDIFNATSKAAQKITSELNVEITPEEKQRIEKPPTVNIRAQDFYWRGKNEYQKYQLNNENKDALDMAEKNYNSALAYDSTFALAYAGLAQIYFDKNYWKEFFKETFLDSVLILANKALLLDNQLAEAYYIKGEFFNIKSDFKNALMEYNNALEFNPNLWEAYFHKGRMYLFDAQEIDQAILNLYQAAILHRGYSLGDIYQNIGEAYNWIGLFNQRNKFFTEAFNLTGDSAIFYINEAVLERIKGNKKKEAEWRIKAYHYNTSHLFNLKQLAFVLSEAEQYKESLKYYEILWERYDSLEILHSKISINDVHRIGYAYWKNGFEDKAKMFFDIQKKYCEKKIELNRLETKYKYVYYDLAAVYAFKNEKEKALENLKLFNERKKMPFWALELIKKDPLFDNIRNEPEFQKIVKDVEAKYLAEHNRVKKWLEEQELL